MTRPQLKITSIYMLEAELSRFRPNYVISICDPQDGDGARAASLCEASGVACHQLGFNDVCRVEGNMVAPSLPVLRGMCAALDRDLPEIPGRLLVHCHAGLSRSPAVALIALAHLTARSGTFSAEDARSIAREVFAEAPMAMPNNRILAIAEKLFGKAGEEMVDEVMALQDAASGEAVSVNRIW